MADEKNDKELSVEEIGDSDLEKASGGNCSGCGSCSNCSPGCVCCAAEPALNKA